MKIEKNVLNYLLMKFNNLIYYLWSERKMNISLSKPIGLRKVVIIRYRSSILFIFPDKSSGCLFSLAYPRVFIFLILNYETTLIYTAYLGLHCISPYLLAFTFYNCMEFIKRINLTEMRISLVCGYIKNYVFVVHE